MTVMQANKTETGEEEYSPISDNALRVLEKRYLAKDEQGKVIETPSDMFHRVAKAIANNETEEKAFYHWMASRVFLPNTPALVNAGRAGSTGTYHACYVLDIKDTMSNGKDGIMDTLTTAAMIFKGGGGVGYSFSKLRGKGQIVSTSKGVASGPVSFMRIYDSMCEQIKQGGVRRGAQMAILHVDHPDIMEFITAKTVEGDLRNFNISVGITNKFIQRAVKDKDKQAVAILDAIIDGAWRNGEPGVVFLDTINENNRLIDIYGDIQATNPCGEQPLYANEPCCLGSIDLAKIYKEDLTNTWTKWSEYIDWDTLTTVTKWGVRFLDNMIDKSNYATPAIKYMAKRTRRIGLGVMGFAHLLYKLGISYNSSTAETVAKDLMRYINTTAVAETERLAIERGTYGAWYAEQGKARRNVAVTTIAPTGSISMIADTSSGIEPVFSLAYDKHVLEDSEGNKQQLTYIDPHVGKVDPDILITAADVPPKIHVRIQAAFQLYTENAVSKTINMPNEATRDDVRQAFIQAWTTGCKGITVYRDRSRDEQVLNNIVTSDMDELPPKLYSTRIRKETGEGTLYVHVSEDENKSPIEIFCTLGKSGGAAGADVEAIGRLVSLALRNGISLSSIYKQLRGIQCGLQYGFGVNKVLSVPDAIGQILGEWDDQPAVLANEKIAAIETNGKHMAEACPSCGSNQVFHTEGCKTCIVCGYSEC